MKEDLTGVWGSGKEHVFVIGAEGALLHSADSGKTWTTAPALVKRALGGHATFDAITGNGAVDVFIVGHRRILRSTDSGKTWKVDDLDDHDSATAVWSNGKDVYVLVYRASGRGAILHSGDGGATWTRIPRADTGAERWDTGLRAITGVGDDLYVVGWAGAILRYSSSLSS